MKAAESKSKEAFGAKSPSFADAQKAASRLEKAGAKMLQAQTAMKGDANRENSALHQRRARHSSSTACPIGTWYKHAIYAPGKYTGYAAVVIPGVNEAIDAGRCPTLTQEQLKVLTDALNRAAETLERGACSRLNRRWQLQRPRHLVAVEAHESDSRGLGGLVPAEKCGIPALALAQTDD